IDKLGGQDPDPFGAAALASVVDEQAPGNLAPEATANMGTIFNGQDDLSAGGNLISNVEGGIPDSDPEGEPLTITEIGGNTTGTVTGNYGTVTWNPNGSYTYQVTDTDTIHALDEGETLTETFTYTLSDGELTDTSDLIVTLEGVNDAPTITVQTGNDTVYEAGLIPDGSGNGPKAIVVDGTFTVGDTDGLDDIQSITLGTNVISIPEGLADYAAGDALVGQTFEASHGTVEITAYLGNGEFAYSYTLTSPTTDVDGVPETDSFNITVSDEAQSASATVTIKIVDDNPAVSTNGIEPGSQVVDDSDFIVNNTKNYTDIFNKTFGADGKGDATYSLTVSADGVDSGVVDSATGNHVFLFIEDQAVVGREGSDANDAASGEIVFSVSVSDGNVTLDQQRSVMHDDSTDPDEAGSPATLGASNLISLTATISDGDGDKASATIDLGGTLAFRDDGPTANDDTPTALTEDGVTDTVAGNVVTNDLSGADMPKSFVDWDDTQDNTDAQAELGKYGTLTMEAGGGYKFKLDNSDPDTQALTAEDTISETLTYTMIDADGDPAQASLIITITGTN
ncbi:MAG: DUF5801 domain-containing protein, partial [Planctomycetales bacterium]